MLTRHALTRRVLAAAAALAGAAVLAPAAAASSTPSLTLNQSAGHAAGSTANLGLDLKFTNSGTDSAHDLTINLPPGLLANASIDKGACLRTADVSGSTCEVGSGTVTVTPDVGSLVNLPASVPVSVSFYLVPPPAAGDLAGLAVEGLGQQIGPTGQIRIRPSGDPGGVGVTLNLTLPDTLPIPTLGQLLPVGISVTEINSTFDSLRYPATCPATPARLSVSSDSYSDSTVHTVSAPLSVTDCSALPFSPAFTVSAARDQSDRQVSLKTTITQAANEAPSRSVSLAFPTATLAPNLASIKALCLSPGSASCQTVGSASATSPLYPTPLSGRAYLTGSSSGLSLTLMFPSPFPLTLTGAVNLAHDEATFTGLPDIPLTNLGVSLSAGPQGLFLTSCQSPTGTATATLTDQNGDHTVKAPAKFTVSGCSSAGGGSASSGGGTSGGASGGGNASSSKGVTVGHTTLSQARLSGLRTGHPKLSFKLTAPRTAKLTSYTITLPTGLRFTPHRSHHKLTTTGIGLKAAKIKKLSLSHRRLTITLRAPTTAVTTTIGPRALSETKALKTKARSKHKPKTLPLTVTATNTHHQHTTIHAHITKLGL